MGLCHPCPADTRAQEGIVQKIAVCVGQVTQFLCPWLVLVMLRVAKMSPCNAPWSCWLGVFWPTQGLPGCQPLGPPSLLLDSLLGFAGPLLPFTPPHSFSWQPPQVGIIWAF